MLKLYKHSSFMEKLGAVLLNAVAFMIMIPMLPVAVLLEVVDRLKWTEDK